MMLAAPDPPIGLELHRDARVRQLICERLLPLPCPRPSKIVSNGIDVLILLARMHNANLIQSAQ